MKSKSGVSVVIPSFNCKKILFRLLDSVKKSDFKNLETVVVDNGSLDGTLKEGKKKYKWVKWVDAGPINIGQAATYNLGFAHANPDNHILYCDADVVLEPDMISHLVKRVESKKKIGIVTPMILYLEDKEWVNQAGSTVNLNTGKVTVGWGPKDDFLNDMQVQGSGTVMLFKNSVLKKIGGFEDWFLCYFDPEYCVRAERAGFVNWYEPKAVCYHDQSKDPNVWRPRVLSRAYLLGRNRTLFMRKFGNMFVYTLMLPAILGYYLIEALRFGIFNNWILLVKGTLVGYLYPLNNKSKIPLPVIPD